MRNATSRQIFSGLDPLPTYCDICKKETGSSYLKKCKHCYKKVEDGLWDAIPAQADHHKILRYDLSRVLYINDSGVIRGIVKRLLKNCKIPPGLSSEEREVVKNQHSSIIESLAKWLDKWYPKINSSLY